jgi:hypothetical protein
MARTSPYKDDPAFCSSSFYVTKSVNTAFNKALLDMRDAGYEVDRSRLLDLLMKQWAMSPTLPPDWKAAG